MNNIDLRYQALLQHILTTGTKKETRNGSVISTFGWQIRHNMAEGFPLLTTKKMYWKGIVTELLWFLRGDTSIEYLLKNDCHIWDGDAFKHYYNKSHEFKGNWPDTKEQFIERIKTDDGFAKKWGDLGPLYGKQWRDWNGKLKLTEEDNTNFDKWRQNLDRKGIDQITNLINELKTNPDSRRLMVNAWNVSELDRMVLPPCHYGFQCYTRELSDVERLAWMKNNRPKVILPGRDLNVEFSMDEWFRPYGVPKRAISLMFNQRSVDTPLGLPFNIASYGLLLTILAKLTNMVPDELIGNLGDCHIYTNQIDGVKEQITREPYELPKLTINTEFWPTESGEAGVGNLIDNVDWLIRGMEIDDFQIENYKSHSSIKMPLSN